MLESETFRVDRADSLTLFIRRAGYNRPIAVASRQIDIYSKPEHLLNKVEQIREAYKTNEIDSSRLYFVSRIPVEGIYLANLETQYGLERICGVFSRGFIRYWLRTPLDSNSTTKLGNYLKNISYIDRIQFVPKAEESEFSPILRATKSRSPK